MDYRIFIGFDHRQSVAYNVCQFSLIHYASAPLQLTPLVLQTLPLERQGLTPFTYSRFLVPYLCGYRGWALFMDSDIIAQQDICQLWKEADPKKAVMVASDIQPFERAAVMLFNCAHPDNRQLTLDFIERAPDLHRITWTKEIGFFDPKWNHCVGYATPRDDAALVHYTMGIPAHAETKDCEYADAWKAEHRSLNSTAPWVDVMGSSIHAFKAPDGSLQPKYKAQKHVA